MRVSLVLVALVMVGCGGGPAPIAVEPPAASGAADTAKSVLEGVIESGELGSGAEELRTAIQGLNKPDLLADVDALESASSPDAAKAKAKEMLGKL
ncbi:MAG: hypothetical protein H6821_14025 [Planctomycetaceae bacterium]|nr:hypothetical protein [Planctomycetales bacterium]MCA9141227.1 hypothetical protein [Planctomycetales bacterium]MCB9875288.1 hypothetical protein [Planctomycetaceae bacterium]MCB9938928.1 hypothetical protein [Planctomycetaceae bacterium]